MVWQWMRHPFQGLATSHNEGSRQDGAHKLDRLDFYSLLIFEVSGFIMLIDQPRRRCPR